MTLAQGGNLNFVSILNRALYLRKLARSSRRKLPTNGILLKIKNWERSVLGMSLTLKYGYLHASTMNELLLQRGNELDS